MRTLKSWWTVSICVSVLSGCSAGTAPGADDASIACGLQGEACCAGAACGFDLFCEGGVCKPEQSDVGAACTKNLDCQSGICLPISSTKNVCTASCTSTAGCVPGWSCGSEPGQPTMVCACTPSPEVCDGKDNDCNGVVDDEPAADTSCVQQRGAGATCVSGSCVLDACKSNGDCLAGQICSPVTHTCQSPDAGTESDGGADAGASDGGSELDGGREDAGTSDSGTEDAGTEDAGTEDAGTRVDAGPFDAGLSDAGTEDAGELDAGFFDAGSFFFDAGSFDAGSFFFDAGSSAFDAGGLPDAATIGVTVRLTWEEDYGDLDLHYIGPEGTFYETSPYAGDLDWSYSWASAYGQVPPTANCGFDGGVTCDSLDPDWGSMNTVAPDGIAANNPALTLDQRWGYGPEVAFHAEPFAGTYQITVHYFCATDESGVSTVIGGSATPRVEVFFNDVLQWSTIGPQLVEEQAWDVAQVVVSDGGTSVEVIPLDTAPYTTDEGCFSVVQPVDAGEPEDAGATEDAGVTEDAGEPEDAGAHRDGGAHRDAGAAVDAGEPADAGDLGTPCTDASTCNPGEVCPLLYQTCLAACTIGTTCSDGEACCGSAFGDIFCPPAGGTCF